MGPGAPHKLGATRRPSWQDQVPRIVFEVSRASHAGAEQAVASAGVLDYEGASAFDAECSDLAAYIDALTRALDVLARDVVGAVSSRVEF